MRGICSSSRGRVSFEPLESRQFLSAAPLTLTPAGSATNPGPMTITSTAIRCIGVSFNAQATQPFSGLVGEIAGAKTTSGLNATIDWGDGTPDTTGTFVYLPSSVANGPLIGIDGNHTYGAGGTYGVTITVTDQVGGPGSTTPVVLVFQIKSMAVVSPENGQGVTLYEPAGQQFTATVGTFNYVPPGTAANEVLEAAINWGDGVISQGLIQHLQGTQYAVIGTHTYDAVGQYTVNVLVTANLVPPPTPVATSGPSWPTPPLSILIADFDSTIFALPSPTPAS
jgi:hypothetical protein